MEGRKNKNGNFIAQIAGKMCIGRMRFWKFFGNCQIGVNEKAERVLPPFYQYWTELTPGSCAEFSDSSRVGS